MTIANVTIYSTFDDWRKTTNELIVATYQTSDRMNTVYSASNSSYAAVNSAIATAANISTNLLIANDIVIGILTNTSNAVANAYIMNSDFVYVKTQANAAYLQSNIAFDQSNSALVSANDMGNTVNVFVNNVSYTVANVLISNTIIVNTINATANSVINSIVNQSVFALVYDTTNSSYDTANSGYLTVNAAYTNANSKSNVMVGNETTNTDTYYVIFSSYSAGRVGDVNVATSKLTFNPNTGTLSSTIYNSLSDVALKENISPITNALDIVNAMSGVGFNWKDNGVKSFGVIAQDIEKVVPELVDQINNSKTVNYDGIIAFLIEAIKELNAKLESK